MKPDRQDPDSFLPLAHTSLYILLALLEGEAHGFGIKRFVEEQTGGRRRMRAGTLYEALARLHANGLISETPTRPDDAGSSRWRYYRLSEFGLKVLRAELRRLESLVELARSHSVMSVSEAGR